MKGLVAFFGTVAFIGTFWLGYWYRGWVDNNVPNIPGSYASAKVKRKKTKI